MKGEFVDDGYFKAVIRQLDRENANNVSLRLRRRWKETYYWHMIQQRAETTGATPNALGRKADIAPRERSTV